MAVTAPDPRRWKALALICSAFFMTVLDVAIVNVALPTIKTSLHFSQPNLQWVITAYSLTFGGFLLLGGRIGDLLGRRLIFMLGTGLFTLASLTCGLAQNEAMLIVARGVQGLGAALISPAVLAIISTTFEEGAERNKALGVSGAVAGSGAAFGVLLGGVLTKYLGWEWIFFVNVPVGAIVLLLTTRFVRESHADVEYRRYDAWGAVTITASLIILVYAISRAPFVGWASARTIGLLAVSVVLAGIFIWLETNVKAPLLRLGIFSLRTLTGANIVAFLLAGSLFAMFFLLTFYMQQVQHYSALQTGVAFLATAGTVVVVAGIAQMFVTRVGVKPILATGMLLLTISQLRYTHLPVHGRYVSDLMPWFFIAGIGLAFAFIPVTIAALAGVAPHEAGLASGLINTSQQVGGAIGVAVASTVYTSHLKTLVKAGDTQPVALTGGFHWAFYVTTVIAFVGCLASLVLIHKQDIPEGAEAVVPA
jgi:EmrB/QacA subfamily drug resistance transporter